MHAQAPRPPASRWREKILRSGYFVGALLLHVVVFLLVATLVIWKAPIAPRDPGEFKKPTQIKVPPPPVQPPASGSAASNPQMDLQPEVVPDVTPPSAITTSQKSSFTMDATKLLNQAVNQLTTALAKGSGNGKNGTGPGDGAGPGFFGGKSQIASPGFEGNFYDFTRTQDGKPITMDAATYGSIIRAFCKSWGPPPEFPCYTSSVKLYSKLFFFPPIADNQAGTAFQTPSSTEAFWIAHYHGSFTSNTTGDFRVVGFGDNLLAVRINQNLALDASDQGYIKNDMNFVGAYRKPTNKEAFLPGKSNGTPVYIGDTFHIDAGQPVHVDIIVGDEGGIFTSGLFLAAKEQPVTLTDNGIPQLPLFCVGTFTDDDKSRIGQYLPPECLTSSVTFFLTHEAAATGL